MKKSQFEKDALIYKINDRVNVERHIERSRNAPRLRFSTPLDVTLII
jgi:hypothetical protein